MQQGGGSPFPSPPESAGNGFDELGLQAVEEHGGGGGSPVNRWPRKETMELLKIRSELDSAFRDATLKAPLWEEVSRKLTELEYHRSPEKCKEKFENVYKYYKRTKEARAGRQGGKSYRFFSQLEALLCPSSSAAAVTGNSAPPPLPTAAPIDAACGQSSSSYSGTESEGSGKRKREGGERSREIMAAFFECLIKQVMERQEAMLQRFLEAIERREQDRMIREEAWRRQEKSRITREHELAAQERAAAASRDDAIISFLQNLTGQTIPIPPPPEGPKSNIPAAETPTNSPPPPPPLHPVSPSRWPKPEVNALIKLRSGMEARYQETGPKGPLWEEISAGMRRLGFNRSAKRCKEKWENINKYFKKVKESNKKRPEDAKTCPYFHQLDALYRSKLLCSAHTLISTEHLAIMAPPKPEEGSSSAATDKDYLIIASKSEVSDSNLTGSKICS